MEAALSAEVFRRLKGGRSLTGLGLAIWQGRFDLRGFRLPKAGAAPRGRILVGAHSASVGAKRQEFRAVDWSDMDLTGCDLSSAIFEDGSIRNCIFDHGDCRRLAFWGSQLADCNFVSADFRQSVLGSYSKEIPKVNTFTRCNFDGANLDGSAHFAEQYWACSFRHANLDGLRFEGTLFEQCVFSGTLSDVSFFPTLPLGEGPELPSNEFVGCDFTKCQFSFLDFRNIGLGKARLPSDAKHIILTHGSQDILDWSKKIDSVRREKLRLYLEALAQRAGTPSIVAASDLRDFSDAEIGRLREIASQP